MSRIYRQAQTVNIWLGGEDKIARNALTTMRDLADFDLTKADQLRSLKITDRSIYEKIGFPCISTRQWLELYAFFNRSWFKRAWIVQEVALSKMAMFFCGLMEFELHWVARFLECLSRARWIHQLRELAEPCIEGNRSRSHMNMPLPYSGEDIKLYQARPGNSFNHNILGQILQARGGLGIKTSGFGMRKDAKPAPLWVTLQNHRSTESTDPRDKVYAFMGISEEFIQKSHGIGGLELIPDYTKPVKDVFVGAAKFMIASQGNLEFLALKQRESQTKIGDLPSWVPDFSAEDVPLLNDGRPMPWTASDGLFLHARHLPGDALEVRATKVGEVGALYGFGWSRIAQLPKFLRVIPEVSEVRDPKMNEKVRKYLLEGDVPPWLFWREGFPKDLEADGAIKHQSRIEVLWRTLLTDCFVGRHPAPTDCGAAVHALMEDVVTARLVAAATSLIQHTPAWPLVREAANEVCDWLDDGADWEIARDKLGRDYTALEILQGRHPYESDDIIYPPEFLTFMEEIKAAQISGKDFECATQLFMEIISIRERASVTENLRAEVQFKISVSSTGKKLFTTVQGQLGIGISSVKTSDEIWVIAGASIPFVLRPKADGQWSLVGEAYVHGIMHGEAVLASSLSTSAQTIILV
jgi:hypothetical protein